MKVTTIGSGTGAPSPTRVCAAHLIEKSDTRLLLDCGSGCVHRMAALGIDWVNITHVAITHFHPDHVSDIATLAYAWAYGTQPRRSAPATFIGPPGFAEFLQRLDAAFGNSLQTLGYELRVMELTPGQTVLLDGGNINLSCFKVPHTAESVAYSMEAGGKRVVYSGDTSFDRSLAEWAAHCDLLLLECSLPASMAVASHLTPEQCAELAETAHPGALALTHLYPPLEIVDVRGIVAQRYNGPIHVAYDGWAMETGD